MRAKLKYSLISLFLVSNLLMYGCGSTGTTEKDSAAPTNPSNLNAVAASASQVNLKWDASTDNVGVTGYEIYRGTEKIGTANTTAFSDTGLSAGNNYCYKIKAHDAAGNISGDTNEACATPTATADTTKPSAPSTLTAATAGAGQINLSWSGSSDNIGVENYKIYRDGNEIKTVKVDTTNFNDSGLSTDTNYCYKVVAVDAALNISDPSNQECVKTSAIVDTEKPSVPGNITAAVSGSGQIDLSWNASTDNVAVAGYDIYRGTDKVGTSTTPSYNNSGLSPDTNYCYTVKAYDAAGNISDASSEKCAKTAAKQDVSQLISEAKSALENQDIAAAKAKFEEAYAGDAANLDANFGLAITKGIMLLEDPDVVKLIQKWDSYAPTVENVVYGAITNTFEVYGGNGPYCGTDPSKSGYTKLTTTSTSSPYIYNGSYAYYLVYVPPFSKVIFDDIEAAYGNENYLNDYYCSEGNISGWYLGDTGDSSFITVGGASMSASALLIKANSGSTGVTVTTKGSAKAMKNLSIGKVIADRSIEGKINQLDQLKGLMDKLPKNRESLLKKMRKAIARTIPSTAPTVSEMQKVIDDRILPDFEDMISMLKSIEGKGYTFTVTPGMTGSSETHNTILDDGEFYGLHATLDALKAILNIVTAYNLDVDYDIIEADPLSAINGPSGGLTSSVDHTKFFTLKSNGAAKMNAALDALKDAADNAKLCYNFVYDQWGYAGNFYLLPTKAVTDNGLKWHDPNDDWSFTKSNDSEIRKIMNAVKLSLNGQATFNEKTNNGIRTTSLTDGTTDIIFTNEPTGDPDDSNSFVFNVTKLFTNPLTRTNLPTMGYDLPINGSLSQNYERPIHKIENGEIIDSETAFTSDVPDWTFNGILPNGVPDTDAAIYNDKTILLPNDVSWGDSWSENIAMGGDGYIFLRKESYSNIKLFKIDPSDGTIIGISTGLRGSGPNKINWINERAWHDSAMWASGGFYNAANQYKQGIFTIGAGDLSLASNQIPITDLAYSWEDIGGIASDGTNLFVGIDYYDSIEGHRRAGIVKVDTSLHTSIPLSPFVIETTQDNDWAPWSLVYGGSHLWLEGGAGTLKVNPVTGDIVKRYTGETGFEVYYNNRLWRIQGRKLTSFIAP